MRLVHTSLLLVFAFALGAATAATPASPNAPQDSVEWPSMRMCVADTLQRTNAPSINMESVKGATELCYSHLHGQGLLNDFKIRRLKFTQQTYDERILLWMVVAITLSGVALAGVQLLASYKLATKGAANFDQQTELALAQGKLSVRSSVTGLLILICSFAFFWVFVYEIYVIHPVDIDRKSTATAPPTESEQIGIGLLQPKPVSAGRQAAKPKSAAASANQP